MNPAFCEEKIQLTRARSRGAKNSTKLKPSDHEEDNYGANENPGSADIIVAVGCTPIIRAGHCGCVADILVTNKPQYMNARDMKIGPI